MAAHPARASWIAATSLVVVALLTFGTRPAAAQNAAAEALFSDGEKLLKEGKVAEACDAFEASNRLEPRAGTLVNLGTCREQNHQLASAWSAFKDALSRAKDPKKKKIAETRIKSIEPRLSYLTISVADESRVDGLVVSRDGDRDQCDRRGDRRRNRTSRPAPRQTTRGRQWHVIRLGHRGSRRLV